MKREELEVQNGRLEITQARPRTPWSYERTPDGAPKAPKISERKYIECRRVYT